MKWQLCENNADAIRLMIAKDNSFDPEIKNSEGFSCVELAAQRDNDELMEILTKEHLTVNKSIDNKSQERGRRSDVDTAYASVFQAQTRNSEFLNPLQTNEKALPKVQHDR